MPKIHCLVHFKWAHFIVYKLNLKKVIKESESTNSMDVWQMQKVKKTVYITAYTYTHVSQKECKTLAQL